MYDTRDIFVYPEIKKKLKHLSYKYFPYLSEIP